MQNDNFAFLKQYIKSRNNVMEELCDFNNRLSTILVIIRYNMILFSKKRITANSYANTKFKKYIIILLTASEFKDEIGIFRMLQQKGFVPDSSTVILINDHGDVMITFFLFLLPICQGEEFGV